MSDLISKREVLAKINLWVNGECDTDELIENIKRMPGSHDGEALELVSNLTERPCEYCKNHVDGRCAAWECVFDDVLEVGTSKSLPEGSEE